MAQHPRQTGPSGQNDATTFEPAMVQGWKPEQPRLFSSRNVQGLALSQTTHVQAPIFPSMFQGSMPPSPRPFRVKLGWTWSDIISAQMTVEMWEGEMPSRPRIFLGPRIGQPLSQTSHTSAPLSLEMSAGNRPDFPRLPFSAHVGWQTSQPTFQVQMTTEQFQGAIPDRSRAWLAPRIPLPLSQTTHISAPVSSDMVEGWQPDRARLPFQGPIGWQSSQTTFQVQMTPEMWAGHHPDQSRAWLAPRIPLPLSQTSHQAAAVSPDMVDGWQPDRARAPFTAPSGWATSQTTFAVVMTPEMWKGSQPDTSRAWIAPKIPLPISQTAQHVQAPFTYDMVAGSKPDRPRPAFSAPQGWVTSQLTFIVAMTPDMFKGWVPDRYRQTLGPRIPLPISQTSHVSAQFGVEMVTGNQPARHRERRAKQVVGWIRGLIQGLFGTPSQPTEFFNVGAQERTFRVEEQGRFRSVSRKQTFAIDEQGRFIEVNEQDREVDE